MRQSIDEAWRWSVASWPGSTPIPERRGLAHAKSVCERWVGQGIASAQEWLTILDQPWEEIRAVLLDDGDEGQRLRQTDPFCGILTPAERWQIYREAQER